LGEPRAISAEHGEGVSDLVEVALAGFPIEKEDAEPDGAVRIAIVGRPNAGKSTLVNALVGEERVVTFDQPGTTRDAIDVELTMGNRRYVLVDTAGLRRRGKVFESVEKFSVVKTLQAIDRSNVAVLVLDAQSDISDQDAHIAGFILERGRAVVVAVNKWDGLDDYARDMAKRAIARKLRFLSFAQIHTISAREGRGLARVLASVDAAYRAAMAKLPTPRLTRALLAAVAKQAPPRSGLSRPKMRYAHQGGSNPPIVVVHGSALKNVPESYRRYLEADFRRVFRLQGTPLRIEFKSGRNPFVDRSL
jgi:GTPase